MKPKLDQFFIDPQYGRMKYAGLDYEGDYLFSTYEKLSSRDWKESPLSLRLNPIAFQIRYEQGVLKESFPPV